ncbi:MAG: hypothetical protein Kow0077_21110 [Anaerolineae bacterium]
MRDSVQQLLGHLARWDRRFRLQRSVIWAPRGVLAALVFGVGLAVLARLRPLLMPEQIVLIAGGGAVAGLVIALAVVWLRQHDPLAMARFFDDRFDLKERVSTALELATGAISGPNPELATRLADDALRRAGQVNAAVFLPLRLRWVELGALVALAVVLAVLLVLPNPQNDVLARQQIVQETLEEQVEQLENLREQIAESESLDEATQRELMEALDEAIEQLSRDEMSQEEAVATLAELAEEMQQIAEQTPPEETSARQRLQQALEEAARTLQDQAGVLEDSQALSEAGEALSQNDLQSAAESLEELAGELDNLSEAEQQALSEALEAAAEQIAEADPELAESMQQAAEALQEGDTQAAQEALENASERMNEMAEAAAQQDATGSQATDSRRIASQAAQQAQQSAQQVAQAGQQAAQQPGQPTNARPDEGAGATRIEQPQEGQSGQSVQSGEGEGEGEAQPAAGSEGGQPGDRGERVSSDDGGAAAGAGDGEGSQSEAGFEGGGEQIPQDNAPDGSGLTEYEPVFAPQRVGEGDGQQLQITGDGTPGEGVVAEGDLVEENPEGEAIVGYDQVFSDYVNAAGEAMERDYIPLSLRDVIFNYFASLEP